MIISNYVDYFHDGSILDILHKDNEIKIIMKSAEITPEEIEDPSILSQDNRLKGFLHISDISKIVINKKIYQGLVKKKYDKAEILNFEIFENQVKFFIEWRNSPPKPTDIDYSSIEIAAEKIWWENIPNLEG